MRGRRAAIVVAAVVAIVVLTFAFVWWAPPTESAFLPFPSDKSCAWPSRTTRTSSSSRRRRPSTRSSTAWACAYQDGLGLRPRGPSARARRPLARGSGLPRLGARGGGQGARDRAPLGHGRPRRAQRDGRSSQVRRRPHRRAAAHRSYSTAPTERPSTGGRTAYPTGSPAGSTGCAPGGIPFEGADPESPYYWVDVSRWLVRYVRGYTTNSLNTLAVNPSHAVRRPLVARLTAVVREQQRAGRRPTSSRS